MPTTVVAFDFGSVSQVVVEYARVLGIFPIPKCVVWKCQLRVEHLKVILEPVATYPGTKERDASAKEPVQTTLA
jgi:hypothetical protein